MATSKRLEITIAGDSSSVRRALREMGDTAEQQDRKLGRVGDTLKSIGKVGGIAFGAAAAGAVGLIGYGVTIASDMEQAEIAFTTMLGSAEKADAFVQDLQAFAATTPFEFAGLQSSASQLLAVGVEADKIIPLMTALGDSTAAVGTGGEGIDRATRALGQMQQKGKVTGEEMLQLVEAGIPAWDALASKLGVDVAQAQEMVSDGQVEVNDLFTALEERAGPAMQRTAGMMEEQSQTLEGLFSTLKDNVAMTLAEVAAPLAEALKESLPSITAAMDGLAPALSAIVKPLVANLGPALEAVMPLLSSLGEQFGRVFGRMLEAVLPIVSKLAEAFEPILPLVGDLAILLIDTLAPVLDALVEALAPVIEQFVEALAPVIEEMKPVFADLALTLVDFIENGLAPMLPALLDLSVAFLPLLPPLTELTVLLVSVLLPILAPLIEGLAKLAEKMGGELATGVEWISEKLSAFNDWLRELIGKPDELRANFKAGLEKIKGYATTAVDGVKSAFDWVLNLPSMLWDAAKSAGVNFANGIIQGLNWVIGKWNAFQLTAPSVDTPFGTLGGFTIGTPDVPTIPFIEAEVGAVVKRPTMALVAESTKARRGGGEIITPAGLMREIVREEAGGGVVLQVQGNLYGDPRAFGRAVADALAQYRRGGGRVA